MQLGTGTFDLLPGLTYAGRSGDFGRETVDLSLGVNLVGQRGVLRGHRIAAEFGTPVYQDLNGPQMETDWTFTIGYQYAF